MPDILNQKNETSYQVGFYAGGVQTRTEMLENGLSAMWTADDQIALWARNSSGSLTLSNQKFKTYGLDSQKVFFTSDLSSAMPDGSYTYYSCYQVPVSVSGNSIYFNLLQDTESYSILCCHIAFFGKMAANKQLFLLKTTLFHSILTTSGQTSLPPISHQFWEVHGKT